jgi:hypothetical protein
VTTRVRLISMAPIKGETPEEKANRFHQKATSYAQKARFQRVVQCLKERPDVLPDVELLLVNTGAMTKAGVAVAGMHTSSHTVAAKMAMKDEVGKGESGESSLLTGMAPPVGTGGEDTEEVGSLPSGCVCIPWDRNVTKVGDVKARILKDALMCAEKAAFSVGNVKVGRAPLLRWCRFGGRRL